MRKKSFRGGIKVAALVLHNIEQRVVGLLMIAILLLAVMYVYFLGGAVVHAVERREIQNDISSASSRLADLEVEYLANKNAITTDLANELGFSRIATKEYVARARYSGQANAQ